MPDVPRRYLVARLAANPEIETVLAVDSRVPRKDLVAQDGTRAEFAPGHPQADHRQGDRLLQRRHRRACGHLDHGGGTAFDGDQGVQPDRVDAGVRGMSAQPIGQTRGAAVHGHGLRGEFRRIRRTSTGHHGGPRPKVGCGRDLLDVEGYVRGLARRRQDIDITIVRPQAILGPRINTRMGSYLSLPVVPTVIGMEPRPQFLHEEDALAAMEHAVLANRPGTYNVAGDGVVTLTQAIRRLRAYPDARAQRAAGADNGRVPGLVRPSCARVRPTLPHVRRVLDTTRMRTKFGFTPHYDRPDAGGFHPPRLIESGHQGRHLAQRRTPGCVGGTQAGRGVILDV